MTAINRLAAAGLIACTRVPTGTPALLLPPADTGGAAALLLARGLVWTVREVLRDGTRTVVFGTVVDR